MSFEVKKKLSLLAALLPVGLAVPAWAEDAPAEAEAAPAEAASAEEAVEYPNHSFQGWIDQEIVGSLDAEDAVYAMFEAALRMNHAINQQFGGKLQLNARWTQLDVLDATGTSVGAVASPNGSLSLLAREAFAYAQSENGKVKFQFGKWYVPVGFELLDPPDLYQYSNSNVFWHFLPSEAVGVLSALTFSDSLNLQLWASMGPTDLDVFSTFGTPTLGERLGMTFGDLSLGVSAFIGPDTEDSGFDKFVADIDGMYQATEDLKIGLELAYRTAIDNGSVGDNEIGAMVMGNYMITESICVTGRADVIAHDAGETEIGLTGAGCFNFAPGWDLFIEVREDINDGGSTNSDLTGALEIIYQFVK